MKFFLRAIFCLLLSISLSVGNSLATWAQEEESPAVAAEVTAAETADLAEPKTASQPKVVLEAKIDVNNTILRSYRKLPGFYPILARILVQNAPYEKVEDTLKISGLTDTQKALIKENLPNFFVGSYEAGNNSLENRINKGYYG